MEKKMQLCARGGCCGVFPPRTNQKYCSPWCRKIVSDHHDKTKYTHIASTFIEGEWVKLPKHELTGRKFGQWTVEKYAGFKPTSPFPAMWICRCTCGRIGKVVASRLLDGKSTKCIDCARVAKIQHGLTVNYTPAVRYYMWQHAKARAKADNLPFNLTVEDVQMYADCRTGRW